MDDQKLSSNVGSTHTNKKHTPSIRMTMHRQSPFIHQQHSWMNEAKFQTSTRMRKERGWRCEWEMWWKGVRHEMKWHWWIRNQIECGFQSWIWRFRFYMSDSFFFLFFFWGGMPAARPSVLLLPTTIIPFMNKITSAIKSKKNFIWQLVIYYNPLADPQDIQSLPYSFLLINLPSSSITSIYVVTIYMCVQMEPNIIAIRWHH